MSNSLKWALDELLSALRMLSAPAEQQIAYLRAQRVNVLPCVDELALEFDDAVRMLPQLESGRLITSLQGDAIRRLDAELTEMSRLKDKTIWLEDALRTSDRWVTIRGLASTALATFDFITHGSVTAPGTVAGSNTPRKKNANGDDNTKDRLKDDDR